MSDLDYETLFNDIMVATRDKRKTLKEVLDRVFEDDSGRTAEVLSDMMRVNEKAQAIESSRPGFMNVISAMRSVRAVREELLQKVDHLMDEIRRFLALKEELANAHLEKLTTLFREELGNPQFRFHFHLLDDQELHHLSEVRSNARRETGQSSETPSLPPREAHREPPPPPPRAEREHSEPPPVRAAEPPPRASEPPPAPPPAWNPRDDYASSRFVAPTPPPVPEPEPEPEPQWSAPAAAPSDEQSWSAPEDNRPSWLSQSPNDSFTATASAPAEQNFAEPEPPAAEAAPEPEPEAEGDGTGGSPYEVDVDVLRILSEETFRPPKR